MTIDHRWFLLGAVLLSACGGSVMHLGDTAGDSGTNPGSTAGTNGFAATTGTGGSTGASGDTATSGVGGNFPIGPSCNSAGPSQALWLTKSEYDNTVRDLLGYDGPTLSSQAMFPDDYLTDIGFRRLPEDPLGQGRLAHFFLAAQFASEWARAHLDAVVGCNVLGTDEDTCANQFIAKFGARAFRHPLSTNEQNRLKASYNDGRSMGAFADGIVNMIVNALTLPQFLQVEVPGTLGTFGPLDPYAMASRLSYFIYRSMPDAALFDAAASGKLATQDDIAQQTRRMLADPKAHLAVLDFFTEWLSLDDLIDGRVSKDPALYPDFDTLRPYMRQETRTFTENVFFGDSLLPTLLTSTATWLNEPLAALYGVGGVYGEYFQPAQVDPATRAGILTHASVLALTGNPNASSPTKRGMFVDRRILCMDVPPPPPNVDTTINPNSEQTTRQRYSVHLTNPTCSACHSIIDGVGFGFEEFDAVGRYRTSENGLPIDATGTLVRNGLPPHSFNGAVDLSTQFAAAVDVSDCVARRWFQFALSRDDTSEDGCSLMSIQNAFRLSRNMQDLVVAIATSTAFRNAQW
jgi:hypothetical protein